MLKKLYDKSNILFAVLWIVLYCVLMSVGDSVSLLVGTEKSVTLAIGILLSLVLFIFLKKNALLAEYGFRASAVSARSMLYYIPVVLMMGANLCYGFALNYGAVETLLYVLSMFCVGFLEEVIFRGLLFRAMEKDNLKSAIIVSSLTFGIGHIVNLFNGSGRSPAESLVQIVFAVLIGFVLVLIFYHGKSLIPCILFHSANNAFRVFAAEGSLNPTMDLILNLVIIVIVLGGYLLYLLKTFPLKEDHLR